MIYKSLLDDEEDLINQDSIKSITPDEKHIGEYFQAWYDIFIISLKPKVPKQLFVDIIKIYVKNIWPFTFNNIKLHHNIFEKKDVNVKHLKTIIDLFITQTIFYTNNKTLFNKLHWLFTPGDASLIDDFLINGYFRNDKYKEYINIIKYLLQKEGIDISYFNKL